MTEAESAERNYNILVYGLERKGCPLPSEPLRKRNFSVTFEKYGAACRLNDYDGVILFQGIFERFELKQGMMDSYLSHSCDVDELDKRKKEAKLLLGQGGFLCFMLTEQFMDRNSGRDFRGSDLAKYHLNYPNFFRENFRDRAAHVTPVLDEFKRFFEVFGAASSYFMNHNDSIGFRALARVGDSTVGVLLNQAEYFVPSLVPDARPDVIAEYFHLLVDAITSVHNKLHQSVPDWADSYQFDEEIALTNERTSLLHRISEIETRQLQLTRYKAALVHSGPPLVADVSAILEAVLGTKVDAEDEFREDIKLVGEDGKVIGVCEVKGINRGVKRENINQTDSHRERSGFDASFPAILVVNTGIKTARSIAEKDQEVATEQVKHAVHLRILVIRTIDLLGLLRLVLAGRLTQDDVRKLISSKVGWLRVRSDTVEILTGE
jgi:hypothetical protein